MMSEHEKEQTHILSKRKCIMMSRPVPLMFVSGPPVYTHVPFVDEESTSVFAKVEEEEELQTAVADAMERKEVDPSILAKVQKVQSPIGQKVYKKLTFVLDDEEIIGNVAKVDGNTMTIEVDGDEDKIIDLELNELRNIIWRGKSLPEN